MTSRALRRAGLTLVEVLVTVALSAILISIVVVIAGQVQSAVGLSTQRLVAVEQVRALEDMIAQDLARMIPVPDGAPAPFTSAPIPFYAAAPLPPLSIERNGVAAQPGDPTVTNWPVDGGRCADQLQIFATVLDTNVTSPQVPVVGRGLIRYMMDPSATGTGGGGTPFLVSPRSGGPKVGRLRRHLFVASTANPAGTVSPKPVGGANIQPAAIIENVVSFQLDYLEGRSLDTLSAGGRSIDVWKTPDDTTKTGSLFLIDGQVTLDCGIMGPRAVAFDDATSTALPFIPIGDPVLLRLKPASAGASLPQTFLVRGRGADTNGKNVIYLSDRPIQEDGNPGVDALKLKAFLPPAAIRMTVVILFGKGPENETARFVRVLPLPR